MVDFSKPVFWEEAGRFHVGKAVKVKNVQPGEPEYAYKAGHPWQILIAHAHTGELEFVAESSLSQYPSEEIPSP